MAILRWLAADLVMRQRCERHAPRLMARMGVRTRPVVVATDVSPGEAWGLCWDCMMGQGNE